MRQAGSYFIWMSVLTHVIVGPSATRNSWWVNGRKYILCWRTLKRNGRWRGNKEKGDIYCHKKAGRTMEWRYERLDLRKEKKNVRLVFIEHKSQELLMNDKSIKNYISVMIVSNGTIKRTWKMELIYSNLCTNKAIFGNLLYLPGLDITVIINYC